MKILRKKKRTKSKKNRKKKVKIKIEIDKEIKFKNNKSSIILQIKCLKEKHGETAFNYDTNYGYAFEKNNCIHALDM